MEEKSFEEKKKEVRRRAWANEPVNFLEFKPNNLYELGLLKDEYFARDHPLEKMGMGGYMAYGFVILATAILALYFILVQPPNKSLLGAFIFVGFLALSVFASITINKIRNRASLTSWRNMNDHRIAQLPENKTSHQRYMQRFAQSLNVPDDFRDKVIKTVDDWHQAEDVMTRAEFYSFADDAKRPLKYYEAILSENLDKIQNHVDPEELAEGIQRALVNITDLSVPAETGLPVFQFPTGSAVPLPIQERLVEVKVDIQIPRELRDQHTHIIARSGGGKTQLMQKLILDDLQTDDTIIVIDSQGEMIPKLVQSKAVDPERLVYITPTDPEYVPAFNLFGLKGDEDALIELYSFILGGLMGDELTNKMSTLFEYCSLVLMQKPDATLHDLEKMLRKNGKQDYQEFIDRLTPVSRAFFSEDFDNISEYGQTKSQIRRRLAGLLRRQLFDRMFSNTESKIDIGKEMNDGKVILIDTREELLGSRGAAMFGRFWIALIIHAMMRRSQLDRRVYFYIDEADQYVNDQFIEIAVRARKRNLCLTLAHQMLSQFPEDVRAAIHTNTAAKFAANVSPEDEAVMTRQMRLRSTPTAPVHFPNKPGGFRGYVSGHESFVYYVELGVLENIPKRSEAEMEDLTEKMRQKYYVHIEDLQTSFRPDPSDDDNDLGDGL